MKERRRFSRFKVSGEFYAVMRPDFKLMGKVENISMGGLSFVTVVFDEEDQDIEPDSIDVLLISGDFYMRDIRCEQVYCIKAEEHESRYLKINALRRGVKFKNLEDHQESQLQHFLLHHTCGAA